MLDDIYGDKVKVQLIWKNEKKKNPKTNNPNHTQTKWKQKPIPAKNDYNL